MRIYHHITAIFQGKTSQVFLLTQHFFRRLFINDIISFEDLMKEKVVGLLALIAVLSAVFGDFLISRYMFIRDMSPAWVEMCFFISYLMVLMGILAVIEWDVFLPDKRDYANLIPLPVKFRQLLLAKFASLFAFVSLFAVAGNVLAIFVFSYYLVLLPSKSLIEVFRFAGALALGFFAAEFCAFFSLILIMGFLMTVFKPRAYEVVSLGFRALVIMVFIFLMLAMITSFFSIPELDFLLKLKANDSPYLYLLPPMWFVGLIKSIMGVKDPLFSQLSVLAWISLIVLALSFFVFAFTGYRRQLAGMLDVKKKHVKYFPMGKFLSSLFHKVFLKNPIQKAVFHFFRKTIWKSAHHRMGLALHTSVAAALSLLLFAYMIFERQNLHEVNATMLSFTLIFYTLLIMGAKSLVDTPASLEANWIFRITEKKNKKPYITGLKKGVFVVILFPVFVFFVIFFVFLWGLKISFLHNLFSLFVSLFLMEVFFGRYHKVPFTCPSVPGKSRVHLWWFFYAIGFFLYLEILCRLEVFLLKNPRGFFVFYTVLIGFFLIFKFLQAILSQKDFSLIFDEKPPSVMISLVNPEEE
ncbi:MAG: hypothetical protein JXB26_13965 [Candidatus Aminicenantes bacterium]|nr:hypothetical protein [Candidatus Aminicenantes bacterium]